MDGAENLRITPEKVVRQNPVINDISIQLSEMMAKNVFAKDVNKDKADDWANHLVKVMFEDVTNETEDMKQKEILAGMIFLAMEKTGSTEISDAFKKIDGIVEKVGEYKKALMESSNPLLRHSSEPSPLTKGEQKINQGGENKLNIKAWLNKANAKSEQGTVIEDDGEKKEVYANKYNFAKLLIEFDEKKALEYFDQLSDDESQHYYLELKEELSEQIAMASGYRSIEEMNKEEVELGDFLKETAELMEGTEGSDVLFVLFLRQAINEARNGYLKKLMENKDENGLNDALPIQFRVGEKPVENKGEQGKTQDDDPKDSLLKNDAKDYHEYVSDHMKDLIEGGDTEDEAAEKMGLVRGEDGLWKLKKVEEKKGEPPEEETIDELKARIDSEIRTRYKKEDDERLKKAQIYIDEIKSEQLILEEKHPILKKIREYMNEKISKKEEIDARELENTFGCKMLIFDDFGENRRSSKFHTSEHQLSDKLVIEDGGDSFFISAYIDYDAIINFYSFIHREGVFGYQLENIAEIVSLSKLNNLGNGKYELTQGNKGMIILNEKNKQKRLDEKEKYVKNEIEEKVNKEIMKLTYEDEKNNPSKYDEEKLRLLSIENNTTIIQEMMKVYLDSKKKPN